jgi:hypothetical protein
LAVVFLLTNSEVDDDTTLSDLDYGQDSVPLEIQAETKPPDATSQRSLTARAAPSAATGIYLIGLELGIVPRFAQLKCVSMTRLQEIILHNKKTH